MTHDTHILRRPHTRTLPKDIRPVHILSAAFCDAREQWFGAMRQAATTEREACTTAHPHAPPKLPSLDILHRIVSQLKSIKAEIFHLLHGMLSNENACLGPPRFQLEMLFAATHTASVQADLSVFTALASSSSLSRADRASHRNPCSQTRKLQHAAHETDGVNSATHPTLSKEYLEALWLARRVWAWCVAVALVTADSDLLSTSLTTAVELFFEAGSGSSVASDSSTTTLHGLQHSCMSAGSRAQGSVYNGFGVLHVDRLRQHHAHTKADLHAHDCTTACQEEYEMTLFFRDYTVDFSSSDHSQSADHVARNCTPGSAFDCTPPARTHTMGKNKDVAHLLPLCSLWRRSDAEHIHACALLYSILVQDGALSAKKLQQWCDYTDTRHDHCRARHDRAEAKKQEGEMNAVVCDMHGAYELACMSPTVCSSSFHASVKLVAQWAYAEDYGTIAAYLAAGEQAAAAHVCVGSATGNEAQSTCPHMTKTDCHVVSDDPQRQLSKASPAFTPFPLAVVCPCVKLLLRMLYEFVVRPRWIDAGVHRSFRPLIDLDSCERKASHLSLSSVATAAGRAQDESVTGGLSKSLLLSTWYVQLQQIHLQRMSNSIWPLPPSLLSALLAV